MVAVISLGGTLTQTRMGVGRVTLSSKGPIRGPNISDLWRKKKQSIYKVIFFFQLIFLETCLYFLEMITLISIEVP